jgi:hypothetical protein
MSDEQDSDHPQSEAPIPMPMPLRRAHETGGEPDMTGRETYNLVTDTVSGLNFRRRDNLMQLVAVVVGLILGTPIGMALIDEPWVGPIVGAIGGLVAGAFISGFALMIYRGVRHLHGKHD